MKTNKKKIIMILIVIFVLILVVPIPTGIYKDGGTKEFSALTYKIVDWNHLCANGAIFEKTSIYFFPFNFASIDTLLDSEDEFIKLSTEEMPTCDPEPSVETNESEYNPRFNWNAVRAGGYIDGEQYPKLFLLKTKSELDEYYNEYKEDYYFGNGSIFDESIKKYDSQFFESNDLIFVLLEEGSGSIRHRVEKLTAYQSDGVKKIDVNIDRIVPEVGTCDMAEWHIFVELSKKDSVASEDDIRVFVDGEYSFRDTQLVEHSRGFSNVSLRIPKEWSYNVYDSEINTDFSVNITTDENQRITIRYCDQFAVCGTGLETKETTLGIYKAKKLIYDNKDRWTYLVISDTMGDYVIENNCSEDYWKTNGEEIMLILSNIIVGDGCASESETVAYAAKLFDVTYDSAFTSFNNETGLFEIMFYKDGENKPCWIAWMRYDGQPSDMVYKGDKYE